MVDFDSIEKKLLELEFFFKKTLQNPLNLDISSYGAGAEYGLKLVEHMFQLLEKYQKKPQNKILKQLYAGFSSISRGVEGFNDYGLDKRFRGICEDIFTLTQNLNNHIKW